MGKEFQNFSITIYFDNEQNQVLISGSNLGSWMDLGLAIEGIGVLMGIVGQKLPNEKGIKNKEELLEYVKSYIDRVSGDYNKSFEIKRPNQ